MTLTLTSPTDNELAVNQEISVKGQTLPKSTVVVYTENDESSLEADATGRFETTIGLVDGINQLVVTVFADDGQEKTVTTDVVYEAET
ncbi:MAG: hypothetical protein ACD_38C00014G0001 [uncultured bacterium]|nr:MAG: hypothetical protein ACD_38C00014G0001 [uncultured bacterium]